MSRAKSIEFLRYAFTIAMALLFMVPFVWMASQSLKSLGGYYRLPPELIPDPIRWDNYMTIITSYPIIPAAINSLIVSAAVTVLQLITASMAGFAFATLRFRGSSITFIVLLTQTMLPVAAILIPLFQITQYLGLVGNLWGMIIPFTFTAYGTFLLTQYFKGIPREIFEAARVDGASYFSIWWRIYLPLAPAGLATLGALVFVFYWNSLLWPLLIAGGGTSQTLPVMLAQMIGVSASSPHLVMAGASLAVFLPLCLFLALQRYFVAGVTSGSVK
ncbi:MAG: carbohydrate ABC transporter permease [Hyphomonas sp.]|nr:carbohydrate ABC transporter permease [Hyphomonas sp.]